MHRRPSFPLVRPGGRALPTWIFRSVGTTKDDGSRAQTFGLTRKLKFSHHSIVCNIREDFDTSASVVASDYQLLMCAAVPDFFFGGVSQIQPAGKEPKKDVSKSLWKKK